VSSGKLTRTKRLQVHLHADDIAAIDEFRFKARMPSRAAAVREILRRGLAEAALRGQKGRRPGSPKQ
jgi:hypothetical protein